MDITVHVAVADAAGHVTVRDVTVIEQGPSPQLKPSLAGLVSTNRNAIPSGALNATIKPANWSAIEPSPGVYNWSQIDSCLDLRPDLGWRCRLYAGDQTPGWLMSQVGTVDIVVPSGTHGDSATVPRWWTPQFQERYRLLHEAAAARYDNDERLVEITLANTTHAFAEPFILGADDPSIQRLWDAGLTKALAFQYLNEGVAMLMETWPTTRVSVAGHTAWQYIENGQRKVSFPEERAMFETWRSLYGEHLVVEDHGLGPNDAIGVPVYPPAQATSYYDYMSSLQYTNVPFGWQLTLLGGSMSDACWMAVDMGGHFVETAGFGGLEASDRQAIHEALLVNAGVG